MKIGILGYGSIGKRHADNFTKLGCEVLIFDPRLHPSQSGFDEERGPLEDGVDGLVIASPTEDHLRHLKLGIEYDVPTLVEKPIVGSNTDPLSIHEIDWVTEAVFVGYNLRFHGVAIKVTEWLAEGRIGTPLWAQIECRQHNDKYLRDNILLNWSHEIDLALHWLGPHSVNGADVTADNTIASVIAASEGGCFTCINLDYVTKPQIRGGVINGTEGQIVYNLVDGSRFARIYSDSQSAAVFHNSETFDDDYLAEATAFKHFLETGDGGKLATKDEGLAVVDFCYQAMAKKGKT